MIKRRKNGSSQLGVILNGTKINLKLLLHDCNLCSNELKFNLLISSPPILALNRTNKRAIKCKKRSTHFLNPNFLTVFAKMILMEK